MTDVRKNGLDPKFLPACLTASSAHLTAEDVDLMNDPYFCLGKPMLMVAYDYGWVIGVPAEDTLDWVAAKLAQSGLSPAVETLLRLAAESGASTIRLDSIAEEIPGLPTYSWEKEVPDIQG